MRGRTHEKGISAMFRPYGKERHSKSQSLLPRSANARSSLAFDSQGGSKFQSAHLPAIAVVGFSSGWGTIPSSSGGIDPRVNESVLINERREKMKRAIRLHAGRTSTPRSARSSLYRESAVPAFSVGFGFLGRDELPLSHRSARTPPPLVSSTPDSVGKLQSLLPQLQLTFPVGVDLKISIKLDKFTGFFDK